MADKQSQQPNKNESPSSLQREQMSFVVKSGVVVTSYSDGTVRRDYVGTQHSQTVEPRPEGDGLPE